MWDILFERWKFFHQAFYLAFKNGYSLNIKTHLENLLRYELVFYRL